MGAYEISWHFALCFFIPKDKSPYYSASKSFWS